MKGGCSLGIEGAKAPKANILAKQREDYLPLVDRLCGCRKANELVPKVLLARFQRESLPFLPWDGFAGDPLSEGFEFEGEPCDVEAIIHEKKREIPQYHQRIRS